MIFHHQHSSSQPNERSRLVDSSGRDQPGEEWRQLTSKDRSDSFKFLESAISAHLSRGPTREVPIFKETRSDLINETATEDNTDLESASATTSGAVRIVWATNSGAPVIDDSVTKGSKSSLSTCCKHSLLALAVVGMLIGLYFAVKMVMESVLS
jgi:hypothetical protein